MPNANMIVEEPYIISVVTATALSAAYKKKVEEVFRKKHEGKEIKFSYSIDAHLIGGILIIDDENYYDSTIKGRLEAMRKSLERGAR